MSRTPSIGRPFLPEHRLVHLSVLIAEDIKNDQIQRLRIIPQPELDRAHGDLCRPPFREPEYSRRYRAQGDRADATEFAGKVNARTVAARKRRLITGSAAGLRMLDKICFGDSTPYGVSSKSRILTVDHLRFVATGGSPYQ